MVFCGFSLSGRVPDSTTIQDYRSRMIEQGLLENCMKLLNKKLEEANLKVKGGTMIVDSTIIESAARPRNIIESDNEPPTKTTSADPDAQWTKNGKGYHYG